MVIFFGVIKCVIKFKNGLGMEGVVFMGMIDDNFGDFFCFVIENVVVMFCNVLIYRFFFE